jgi:hypothetical protein
MAGCDFSVTVRREDGWWYYRACIGRGLIVDGWIKGSKSEAIRNAIHDAKEVLEEQRKESKE